jgi:hypothetical protein
MAMMKLMKQMIVFLAFMALTAPFALAGNVYGSITEAGKPIAKGVKIDITCGAKNYSAESDANGAFKIFVTETGKCELKVNYQGQTPSFEISSYEGSVQYDLALEKKDGKYTIKRK